MPTPTIPGIFLEDQKGNNFLVALFSNQPLTTAESIKQCYSRCSRFQFPVVLATLTATGQYRFVGEHSLTTMAHAKIGLHAQWHPVEPRDDPPPA